MPFDFAPSEVGLALAIVLVAYCTALPAWFFRQLPRKLRTLLVIGQGAVLFSLPWAYPAQPVVLKAFVLLSCCGALPPKLADMYLHPDHWRGKSLREWIIYLIIPFTWSRWTRMNGMIK